jgi:hypothetical protein
VKQKGRLESGWPEGRHLDSRSAAWRGEVNLVKCTGDRAMPYGAKKRKRSGPSLHQIVCTWRRHFLFT